MLLAEITNLFACIDMSTSIFSFLSLFFQLGYKYCAKMVILRDGPCVTIYMGNDSA